MDRILIFSVELYCVKLKRLTLTGCVEPGSYDGLWAARHNATACLCISIS